MEGPGLQLLRIIRLVLPACCLLPVFAAGVHASRPSSMPEPAPPFQRQVQPANAGGSASFRVQTATATTPVKTPTAAAPFSAGVIKTDFVRPQTSSVPPEQFRAWLQQTHPAFAAATSTMSPGAVLEVKGVYDNSSRTLKSLGIPFRQIRGGDLVDMPLAGVRVIVVNCPGRVPREAFSVVRDFVAAGGYLLSTDWSSDNLVEQVFPGYIQWDRHSNRQSLYDAETVLPDPRRSDFLRPVASLFAGTVTNAGWKMDIDSHMIALLKKEVRPLAVSRQLAAEDAGGRGVLAAVFPYGRGYVLHLVGHFDNNTMMPFANMLADPAPVIGISLRQAIAANFVVSGLSGAPPP
jgi:hypothetical protein